MTSITTVSVSDLRALTPDWERSLRAANKAPKTILIYREAANRLVEFLLAHGMPTIAPNVHREHVEAYLEAYEPARRSTRPAPAQFTDRSGSLPAGGWGCLGHVGH